MNPRVINILSIACLVAVVGVMSWRDMHPAVTASQAPSAWGITTYYAGPAITPAMIPDDNRPVTIDAGVFSYAPDGKLNWTPHGMPPATFAQRQINLQFNFRNLPRNPDKTIEKINAVTEEWVRKGNMLNNLMLNYSPAKASIKGYVALLQAANKKFVKNGAINANRYIVFASINRQWGEEAFKSLREYSPQFLVALSDVPVSLELLTQLAALKYNLVLQYPAGTRVEDVDMESLKKLNSLSGIVLTLDAQKPLPKREEKIGLFPKF